MGSQAGREQRSSEAGMTEMGNGKERAKTESLEGKEERKERRTMTGIVSRPSMKTGRREVGMNRDGRV